LSVQRTGDLEGSASRDIDVLIFVVACTRLDRYEESAYRWHAAHRDTGRRLERGEDVSGNRRRVGAGGAGSRV